MSLASPRGRRSYSRSRSPGPGRDYRDPGGEENVGTVFVGNLNHETTEKSLRDFFETYGRVLETKIVHDIETGRSRGFGFVKFEDARDADDAIAEADGRTLEGRHIKCNMAKYSRGGGGFRGGGPPGPGGGSFRGDFRGGFRGGDRGGFRGRMGPPMRGGYHHGPPSYNEGRPAERAPPRRSRSPSLGRYSPGRYTSPPRSPGRFAPSTRKRKVPGSPGGSYTSDSKSSGSYSTTDSEGDSKSPRRRAVRPRPAGEVPQIGAAPTAPPTRLPDQGAIKNELVQARRRESEMSTRMAALEAEVKQSKATREDQTAKINELTERVQKAEGDVKQYRKWFHAMCKYSREVLLAQQATKQAEEEAKLRAEDLALFLQEADNFVAKEKGKSGRRRRKDAEGVALEGEEGAMIAVNAPEAGGEALAIDTPQAMQPSGGIQNGMP